MKKVHLRIILLAAIISLACTTKVSEWVLLNAPPNEYTLVYFHKGQVPEASKHINDRLVKEISAANIRFRDAVKDDAVKPYYCLYYENRLFARYDDPALMNGLVSSPLRQSVAKELMAGNLCVMLLLKSGNAEKDRIRFSALKSALAKSPFGGIIPVVELDRDNATEKHFITMLLNVEDDLRDIREPMLFGIFGRFKALEPLVGGGISEENVGFMIDFLTADCSCLIKDDLPGTDILFTNSWESPAVALVNAILDANPALMHQ